MKKIISLLLTALMLLGLCGCGTGLDLDANDLIGSSESAETGFQSEEASTSSEEQEPEDITGKIENNLYKNEFLGITFNLPSGWTFYTEDQIADINNSFVNMFFVSVSPVSKEKRKVPLFDEAEAYRHFSP